MQTLEELQERITALESIIAKKDETISLYEKPGTATLFYALQRKANEMAQLLNSTNLKTINLDDAKDKTFDRLKIIWNDAASISEALKTLGAGMTGDEEKDTKRKPFSQDKLAGDRV